MQQDVLPAEPAPVQEPRRSGRERRIPTKPGNIYGEKWNPINIEREDRRRALRPEPEEVGRSQIPDFAPEHKQLVPGHSSARVPKGPDCNNGPLDILGNYVAKLCYCRYEVSLSR